MPQDPRARAAATPRRKRSTKLAASRAGWNRSNNAPVNGSARETNRVVTGSRGKSAIRMDRVSSRATTIRAHKANRANKKAATGRDKVRVKDKVKARVRARASRGERVKAR